MNDIEEAISYIENTKKYLLHLGETWYADCLDDAIELLKEQEEQIKNRDESLEKAREEIKWLRGMLKEQEAEWIEYPECLAYDGAYSDSHIVCSACKHVFSIMDNCTEEFDYCPHCGAKMKQEGR